MTGKMLAVCGGGRVENGVGVDGTVDSEVEVCHSAVAGCRQDLGQHRHDPILVLRQPHVPATVDRECEFYRF